MRIIKSGRCPVCASAAGAMTRKCDRCETAYHLDCWDYNEHCAVYGCYVKPKPVPERRSRTRLLIDWLKRRGAMLLKLLAIVAGLIVVFLMIHRICCTQTHRDIRGGGNAQRQPSRRH